MKKTMIKSILAISIGFCFVRGINAQERLAPPNSASATASAGQSEIIFNAENSDKDIVVWINGVTAAHVRPNSSEKIIVNDGPNKVEAADTSSSRSGWNIGRRKEITVNSNSNRVTIGLTARYGTLLNLTIQGTVAIAPAATGFSVEDAIYRAADVIMKRIPREATIAVLSVSSRDRDLAEFIIEEMAYLLVDAQTFTVVDRNSLNAIKAEMDFQSSGDVDDNSAVSIGKMLGATIVITGSLSGSGATARLRMKALDVQTAEILAMASERY